MDKTGGAGTGANYYGRDASQQPAPGGGFSWTNAVGNPTLRPETANTWTAGVVIQSPFEAAALRRLRFTVDWYSIKLKDAIGLQSAGTALQQCLDPFWNSQVTGASGSAGAAIAAANNRYCAGIRYDPAPILGAANFDVTYYNNGQVDIQGIDGQVDWALDIGPGQFTTNVLVNYYLHYKSTELANNPLIDYSGTLGTGQNALNPGAFQYRVLATVGYGIGPARVSVQWQHLPSVEVEGKATGTSPNTGYPAYNLFNLNGTVKVTSGLNMRWGVDNLFNKAPPIGNVFTAANPTLGQLPGGGFNGSFYDIIGRRYYMGINMKF
jgi:outer membrane receptor protein involved in Fe transport